MLDEELAALLGAGSYGRSEERRGYRYGSERRRLITEVGPVKIEVPRGWLLQPDGTTTESQSQVLPHYARRTRRVDEAILGAYLAGVNTRRILKALAPLLGEANLSKSAVSRVVGRLKGLFESWDHRDLSAESLLVQHLHLLLAKPKVQTVCGLGDFLFR